MGINALLTGRGIRVAGTLLALACVLGGWAPKAKALTESSLLENLPGSQTDVLLVSDIHFNPLLAADGEGPALAQRLVQAPIEQWRAILDAATPQQPSAHGQDTNWALLRSTLGAMHTADPHPGLIVHTGDMIAHDFRPAFNEALPSLARDDAAYRAFVRKTALFVLTQLETAYPKVPLVTAIGNNDSECDDYALTPDGDLLKATAGQVASAAGLAGNADVIRDWQAGGNFDSPHPLVANTRILSFNSVGLSAKYANKCGARGHDGDLARASLAWLHEHLAAAHAAGQKVWIVTHIPPGMNAYEMSKTWNGHSCQPVTPYFAPGLEEAFEQEVLAYPGTVSVIFAGHTHMDDIRLLGEGAAAIPVLITPGVSPQHGQSPAFKRGRVAADGRLLDLGTYAYADTPPRLRLEEGPPRWRLEYDMARTWAVKDLSANNLRAIINRLSHEVDWSRYRRAFSVSSDDVQGQTPANSQLYRCTMAHTGVDDAQRCVCEHLTP